MSTVPDLSGNSPLGVGGVDSPNEDKTVTGSFSGTGQSAAIEVVDKCNVVIDANGATATVAIERRLPGDAGFTVISRDSAGNPASYAVNTLDFNGVIEEPEGGAEYRLNCTAYTSGTVLFH